MKHVFLYGPPASGKTTLGRELAERLGRPFVDLDAEITRVAQCSISDLFARQGEAAFRRLESQTLAAILGSVPSSMGSVPRGGWVIALGGGTLLDEENRRLCEKNGSIICLDAPSEEELARRIAAAHGSRPLGNKAAERAAHYASFPNRIAASFAADQSWVLVGNGLTALWRSRPTVLDANVAHQFGSRFPTPAAVIPSGEVNKTPATVLRLWQAFARAELGRRDVVVAVGGGVTGDLTGFAAATWMRGIDWINVPTTLLSMVDASTGGKTGCDLPEGKNLAGAFHQPRLVVIDTDFLSTLSPSLIADGRSEMIKHEIIGGRLASGDLKAAPSARDIADNLMVKVDIVRADPLERLGRRVLLNCGHTVAHAVEKLTDYRFSHGAAVAIGCVEEARVAVRLGLAPMAWPDELAKRFAAAGLSTNLPTGLTWETMCPVMRQDKKRSGSHVTFALPCGWCDVRLRDLDLSGTEVS